MFYFFIRIMESYFYVFVQKLSYSIQVCALLWMWFLGKGSPLAQTQETFKESFLSSFTFIIYFVISNSLINHILFLVVTQASPMPKMDEAAETSEPRTAI